MNTRIIALGLCCSFGVLLAQGTGDISLEEIWKYYTFYDRTTQGIRSMADGEHYTTLATVNGNRAVIQYAYASGKPTDTLVHGGKLPGADGLGFDFDSYQFGPNEKRMLLAQATESIYRHSSRSFYWVYHPAEATLRPLDTTEKQQLAAFSPTENKIAYVQQNHIHLLDLDQAQQAPIEIGQGKKNAFIAGAVDWVYEEEFSFHRGFEWSPDGQYIAYYQFDEREVPLFSMDVFGDGLYPQEEEFKYPKAGEVNSRVSIHLYHLPTGQDRSINIPVAHEYIPRIQWSTEAHQLVITTLNRLQNDLHLWKVDAQSGSASLLLREQSDTYLEIDDDLTFLPDGSFIWSSENTGYKHLYHYEANGTLIRQITKGNYPVTAFYGTGAQGKWLYYQSAESHPTQREIYRITIKGRNKQLLSEQAGWNSATFSEGCQFFIHRYSAAGVPTIETLRRNDGRAIRVLEDNAKLQKLLAQKALPQKEFIQVPNRKGQMLNAYIIKPADFDSTRLYPLLMFVYGGPGAQTVTNRYDGFNTKYFQYLASKGYLVASVDNQGTGARGRDFRAVTYRQLGKYETQDQIDAARYFMREYGADPKHIGIWGWSYGGYMSSLCITQGADVFSSAIAVAPVTNWRFYDNIYTERYMQTPQMNGDNYDLNSPLSHVKKLKGNYLLIHGSADDNVHLQNSMRMVSALVAANKQFDLFIYPDKNHGIGGGNTRYHLYRKLTDFIQNKL